MRYWGKSLNITLMRLVDDGQFGTFSVVRAPPRVRKAYIRAKASGEVAVSVWDLPRKE